MDKMLLNKVTKIDYKGFKLCSELKERMILNKLKKLLKRI